MIYKGIVADHVYHNGTLSEEDEDMFIRKCQTEVLEVTVGRPARMTRIYGDEIPLIRGLQAFKQADRVFINRFPGWIEAWRAWRSLI